MEGEDSDSIFGYQNQRILLKRGLDNSDGSGEKSSVDCGVAAYLRMKPARTRRSTAILPFPFRLARASGVWPELSAIPGLTSFRPRSIFTTPSYTPRIHTPHSQRERCLATIINYVRVEVAPFQQCPHHFLTAGLGSERERCLALFASCVGIDVASCEQYFHDPLMPIQSSPRERCPAK